jgi:quinolinate synthase
MIDAARMRQLCAIRRLKEDRAAIALARAREMQTVAANAADVADVLHNQMQAELHPRLLEHLRAASELSGVTSRYTTFVMAANTDRQALATQCDISETAQREADEGHRAAEACRMLYAVAVRQRDSLEKVAEALNNAETRLVLQREEDRLPDQRPMPAAARGSRR